MSTAASVPSTTYVEYVAAERVRDAKHEFYDGLVYAMAGGTLAHAEVALAIGAELHTAFSGKPCRVFSSDARVHATQRNAAFYPDVTVACGDLVTHPSDPDGLTNPCLLVEVLSPGTEAYDRGKKFEAYPTIQSLQAYLLADPDQKLLELYVRTERDTWELFVPDAAGTLLLSPWKVELHRAQIFSLR